MELLRSTSRGGFSVRGIFTFAMTVLLTALLSVLFLSASPAHAAENGVWNGESIMYDGHQYYNAGQATAGDSHGLAVGTHYYLYIEVVNERPLQQKAHVIYFAPGSDPPKLDSASYRVYDFSSTKVFSNPTTTQTITVTPRGESDQVATSCAIDGVGWIVCSLSVFLAQGMDWVFSILTGFVEVQPPKTGDTNGDLYIAWNVMRSIANVVFIIVFMIIIYSQLTSVGLSNYGLKKLVPRLIIAAILVNISYFICALAIDLSNVIGYSFQDIFIEIRNGIFNIDNDTWTAEVISWESVTGFVLSGGTAIAAVGVGATLAFLGTAGGSVVSVIFLLLPALLALLLAVLVVLVILAARQAIIILLLIVAPLAFVAYLLPNTEKWFEKWRDLFMTMLIFFPAFSLVFGGSQLAGAVIIQNASSITTMILGMIVQVAPLVIAPLLLKLSGSLLGRIAGLVNDPSKGVLDRTKNWANANAAYHAQRNRNGMRLNGKPLDPNNPGQLRRRNFVRRAARGMNEYTRRLEDRTKNMNAMGDNLYHGSSAYASINENAHHIETDKKRIESTLERDLKIKIRNNAHMLEHELTARVRADQAADAGGKLDAAYEGLKSGADATLRSRYSALHLEAVDTTRSVALTAMKSQSAKREQAKNLYADLKNNTLSIDGQLLREYAGGVQGHNGAQRALAQAISEQHKAHAEVITNANAILDDYNLDANENLSIAKNSTVKGVTITDDIREAAIKRVGANGVIPHINELLKSIDLSPAGNEDFRTALVDSLRGNSGRPKYIGMGLLDKFTQGIPGGVNDTVIDGWIEAMLVEGKLSASELATQDKDTLARIAEALPRLKTKGGRSAVDQVSFNNALVNLKTEVGNFRSDTDLANKAGERHAPINDIESHL